MRGYFISVSLLICLSLISCGRTNPITADDPVGDIGRNSMYFNNAIEIFSGNVNAPSVDADNCEVTNGPNTGDEGTPWSDDDSNNWGVATAIDTDSTTGAHQVIFSKMRVTSGSGYVEPEEYVVPFPDLEDPDNPVTEARLPKVTACYFDESWAESSAFVELTFAYQYLDETVYPADWEIAVARCRFYDPEEDLDDIEPDWYEGIETIADPVHWNIEPDIAYDPTNGDLYVVCATYVAPGSSRLFIIYGDRSADTLRTLDWDDPV